MDQCGRSFHKGMNARRKESLGAILEVAYHSLTPGSQGHCSHIQNILNIFTSFQGYKRQKRDRSQTPSCCFVTPLSAPLVSFHVLWEVDDKTELHIRRFIGGNIYKDKGRGVREERESLQAMMPFLWQESKKELHWKSLRPQSRSESGSSRPVGSPGARWTHYNFLCWAAMALFKSHHAHTLAQQKHSLEWMSP